ncbi:hypothetical protein [Mycobacterium sp. E802]|uniref:hypothetical protein n=1 Tax=Mycobacterium sp. E802 TaxID=1834152 RepID=UPI0012F8ABBC|nr:hypothetical protein [Mycobacterium sp. E802]
MTWASTLLQSLSQAAGVAGLLLGIYNYRLSRRNSVIARQSELRKELHVHLRSVDEALVEVKNPLLVSNVESVEDKLSALSIAVTEISNIENSLISPSPDRLRIMRREVEILLDAYKRLALSSEGTYPNSSSERKKVLDLGFQAGFDASIAVRELRTALAQIDTGSDDAYKLYSAKGYSWRDRPKYDWRRDF